MAPDRFTKNSIKLRPSTSASGQQKRVINPMPSSIEGEGFSRDQERLYNWIYQLKNKYPRSLLNVKMLEGFVWYDLHIPRKAGFKRNRKFVEYWLNYINQQRYGEMLAKLELMKQLEVAKKVIKPEPTKKLVPLIKIS